MNGLIAQSEVNDNELVQRGEYGTIELSYDKLEINNNELNTWVWYVVPSCSEVRVYSAYFAIEQCCDQLLINGVSYGGEVDHLDIDRIIDGDMTIQFESTDIQNFVSQRGSFKLQWTCDTGKFVILLENFLTNFLKEYFLINR